MLHRALLLGVTVGLLVCTLAFADIPKVLNFQGRLTDAGGKFVSDGDYTATFKIYNDSTGGSVLWQEAQVITLSKGLFNATLGVMIPIPENVFATPNTWLGIKVMTDPEMTPRQRLSSLGYAYRTAKADTTAFASYSEDANNLDGQDATAFATAVHNHDVQYVNTTGPDSIVSTSETAFAGKTIGNSSSNLSGVRGYASNSSNGQAWGGLFTTSDSGTGEHYGVRSQSYASSSPYNYGIYGTASTSGSGYAYGAYFHATSLGTGMHFGVYGASSGSSSSGVYGVSGSVNNSGSGFAYGGDFLCTANGTGIHYGVSARAYGNSSSITVGSRGDAENTSTGNAYAGYFSVSSSGTGTHYGIYASEVAGGLGAAVYAAGDFAASGTKNAVLKTSKGHRLMSVIESPEVWFEDFGEGQLINGRGHVELDPLFLETVTINNLYPMKVFIQLKDDCRGTYVKSYSTSFDVFELQGGTSNASFSYRVIAKRKGYETERMRETDVGKDDPNLYPELWAEIKKRHQEEQTRMEQERIEQ